MGHTVGGLADGYTFRTIFSFTGFIRAFNLLLLLLLLLLILLILILLLILLLLLLLYYNYDYINSKRVSGKRDVVFGYNCERIVSTANKVIR